MSDSGKVKGVDKPNPAKNMLSLYPSPLEGKNHYLFIGLLTAIYLLMLFIVNPIGEFPLNDDWAYSHPVFSILNKCGFGPQTIGSPILIAQVLWGYLFCLFTGFSFTTLRFSTLVLALAGVYILYLLLFNISKSKRLSFLVALLLLVNPIYFSLANTFMTDVPYITFELFAIYFFFKALNISRFNYLIIATFFSVVAVLIRQVGLIIPLIYAVTAFLIYKHNIKKRFLHLLPFIITAAAYEIALLWLKKIGSEPHALPSSLSILFDTPGKWLIEAIKRIGNVLFLYGLFYFPFLLLIKINIKSLKSNYILPACLLCIAALFIIFYRGFPGYSIINNGSIGPKSLSVFEFSLYCAHTFVYPENFSNYILIAIYFFGICGAILFLYHLFNILRISIGKLKTSKSLSAIADKNFFIGLCIAVYVFLILIPFSMFDRYMIPLFPLLSFILIPQFQNKLLLKTPVMIFSILYISIIALFSSFGTHDYLSWNRARWQAVDYLVNNQKISMHKIDAGYEANGWLQGYDGRMIDDTKPFSGIVDGYDYILSFGLILDDYTPIHTFPFKSYIPPHDRFILIMHNNYDTLRGN